VTVRRGRPARLFPGLPRPVGEVGLEADPTTSTVEIYDPATGLFTVLQWPTVGLLLLGVGIGMTLLPLMGRGLGDILGDVSPYDPGIYGMVIGLMIAVAVIATLAPTRRALKVDPAAALRYE